MPLIEVDKRYDTIVNAKALAKLRLACAVAGAWFTPGQFPPDEFVGIRIPEKDYEMIEIATMLREALEGTEG